MSAKPVSTKRTSVDTKTLECIGYMTPMNDPDIITSIVIRDTTTGVKFSASMTEALLMAKEGHLLIPPPGIGEAGA